jgi:uncharacterized phage protein gp47/JayE
MALKSFESFLNDLLTDYHNQAPEEDVSAGSLAFIRFACTASALWGMEKERGRLQDQIFPDTAEVAQLEHHAWIQEIVRVAGESDASLLARLLEIERTAGRGGNRYDYPIWAKEASVAEGQIDNPASSMLSNGGMGNFSAAACVDGDTGTKAWDTDSAAQDSTVDIDLGEDNCRSFVKLRLYMSAAGYTGTYAVECWDLAAWQPAHEGFAPTAAGWNEVVWTFAGCYRKWRLRLENTPGAGPDIMEIEVGVAAETVKAGTCFPLAGGAGTVDLRFISSGGFYGIPSDTLLAAVQDKIGDKQPADLPEANVGVYRPGYQFEVIDVTTEGDCDTAAAAADIASYVNGLGIGQKLYKTQLAAICLDHGASNAVVNTPAVDVDPGATGIVRTGSVTVS